ncbi:hypothetical protein I552_3852 [Mycobacterium xenopi 3993]|nr:hypothetical protein I552_3852 [Mycobacterium xenopi 3993]
MLPGSRRRSDRTTIRKGLAVLFAQPEFGSMSSERRVVSLLLHSPTT